ncbi:MAG TPA: hypothetical protein VF994_05965, partial [Myxococcales bacterium]
PSPLSPVKGQAEANAARSREQLSNPRMNREGVYLVTPGELDTATPPPLREGDAVEVEGQVWGVTGANAADLHCTHFERLVLGRVDVPR